MDANPEDDRDPSTVRMDLLVDQVNALLGRMDEVIRHDHGTTQTVIHKTAGMGAWGAAAVTACMFTFLGLILFALVVLPTLHDLQAWQDIMRQRISRIEAAQPVPERKP
jgi:class 3 adenylate cyclase